MKLVFFLFLMIGCSTATKFDQKKFDKEFALKEIAPETYVVTDKIFYHSNILVAKMKGDTVFIASSPFDSEGGRKLISWIRFKWNPKKIVAVNTHFHTDGTGANEAYKEEGVEIWASEMTKNLHAEKGEKSKTAEAKNFATQPEIEKRILKRKIVLADHTFNGKQGKEFDFSGEKVLLIYPGPAHSKDNVVAFLPSRKVLYGTCMIRPGDSLGAIGDADIKNWSTAVKKIQSLDAEVVIPGHGPVGGPNLISKTIEIANKAALNHSKK